MIVNCVKAKRRGVLKQLVFLLWLEIKSKSNSFILKNIYLSINYWSFWFSFLLKNIHLNMLRILIEHALVDKSAWPNSLHSFVNKFLLYMKLFFKLKVKKVLWIRSKNIDNNNKSFHIYKGIDKFLRNLFFYWR